MQGESQILGPQNSASIGRKDVGREGEGGQCWGEKGMEPQGYKEREKVAQREACLRGAAGNKDV